MDALELFRDDSHVWLVLGRDPTKPEKIIDTNQYMILSEGKALLLDPGGVEVFPSMLSAVVQHVSIDNVIGLFASHQDPDIVSSLGMWDRVAPHAKLYAPWLWEGFIRHFGCEHIEYVSIPDNGMFFTLGNRQLEFVPAHYLHSSGNFNVYDPRAKILMSGDIGAALQPAGAPFFVENFANHVKYMEGFHRRWMPSNKAKQKWINRVRQLDIEYMAPQHGSIFKGEDVQRFLDWFEALEVGLTKE